MFWKLRFKEENPGAHAHVVGRSQLSLPGLHVARCIYLQGYMDWLFLSEFVHNRPEIIGHRGQVMSARPLCLSCLTSPACVRVSTLFLKQDSTIIMRLPSKLVVQNVIQWSGHLDNRVLTRVSWRDRGLKIYCTASCDVSCQSRLYLTFVPRCVQCPEQVTMTMISRRQNLDSQIVLKYLFPNHRFQHRRATWCLHWKHSDKSCQTLARSSWGARERFGWVCFPFEVFTISSRHERSLHEFTKTCRLSWSGLLCLYCAQSPCTIFCAGRKAACVVTHHAWGNRGSCRGGTQLFLRTSSRRNELWLFSCITQSTIVVTSHFADGGRPLLPISMTGRCITLQEWPKAKR